MERWIHLDHFCPYKLNSMPPIKQFDGERESEHDPTWNCPFPGKSLEHPATIAWAALRRRAFKSANRHRHQSGLTLVVQRQDGFAEGTLRCAASTSRCFEFDK